MTFDTTHGYTGCVVWLYDLAHAKQVAEQLVDAFLKLHEWILQKKDESRDSSLEYTQCVTRPFSHTGDSAPMASNFQDDACDFMIPIQWSVGRVSTYLSWCMQKIGFPDLDYYEIQPWQELDKYTVYRNRQVRINVSTQKPHFHSCSWGDCCMDV